MKKKKQTNYSFISFLFLANTKTKLPNKQQQTTKTRFCLDHRIEEEKSLV